MTASTSTSSPTAHPVAGVLALLDDDGQAAHRYDASPGTVYLVRPDQHVCARFRRPAVAQVRSALARALGSY